MWDEIDRVEDSVQRRRLIDAFRDHIARTRRFGLVYESNPECRFLWGLPIRVGDEVHSANPSEDVEMTVERVWVRRFRFEGQNFPLRDFVRVASPGEVTFPNLEFIQSHNEDAAVVHRLIEGDNLDALHLMAFVESKSYDVIYIDPPYGSGSTEYTYNNRFVNPDDSYASSLWLSMMSSRLSMAKKLIRDDGVLIIAIDDFHMHNLRVLLDQEWRGWRQHVVAVRHNPSGGMAAVSRIHEYCIFLSKDDSNEFEFIYDPPQGEWHSGGYFRRGTGRENTREGRWRQFFAILVDENQIDDEGFLAVVGAEDPVGMESGRMWRDDEYEQYSRTEDGLIRVYPVSSRPPYPERPWRNGVDGSRAMIEHGSLRCSRTRSRGEYRYSIGYRQERFSETVRSIWGEAETIDGVERAHIPPSRYNAGTHGTDLLKELLGQEDVFTYSKSLYTVADAIEAVSFQKPNAKILDFYAGSGTACHATMLINAIHGGRRQCTIVTNNEMHRDTINELWENGLRPESQEWEECGNARRFTFPRCVNAIRGTDGNGDSIDGEYLYRGRAISEGFEDQGIIHQRIRFNEKSNVERGLFAWGEDLSFQLFNAGGRTDSFRIITNGMDIRVVEEEIAGGETNDLTTIFVNSFDESLCSLASSRFSPQYRVMSLLGYREYFHSHPIPAHSEGVR